MVTRCSVDEYVTVQAWTGHAAVEPARQPKSQPCGPSLGRTSLQARKAGAARVAYQSGGEDRRKAIGQGILLCSFFATIRTQPAHSPRKPQHFREIVERQQPIAVDHGEKAEEHAG